MAQATQAEPASIVTEGAGNGRLQVRLIAAGGMLGALAASACCILPLVFVTVGISGAWIGNLTALAPYKPYFAAGALVLVSYGYYLVYVRSKQACADGSCSRPLPGRIEQVQGLMSDRPLAGREIFAAGEQAKAGQDCESPLHRFHPITLSQEMVTERSKGHARIAVRELNSSKLCAGCGTVAGTRRREASVDVTSGIRLLQTWASAAHAASRVERSTLMSERTCRPSLIRR